MNTYIICGIKLLNFFQLFIRLMIFYDIYDFTTAIRILITLILFYYNFK